MLTYAHFDDASHSFRYRKNSAHTPLCYLKNASMVAEPTWSSGNTLAMWIPGHAPTPPKPGECNAALQMETHGYYQHGEGFLTVNSHPDLEAFDPLIPPILVRCTSHRVSIYLEKQKQKQKQKNKKQKTKNENKITGSVDIFTVRGHTGLFPSFFFYSIRATSMT